jgi:hypothetical protein
MLVLRNQENSSIENAANLTAPTEMEQQQHSSISEPTYAQKHKNSSITTVQTTHQEDLNKLKRPPYK